MCKIKKKTIPTISVIIPVYNAGTFLNQCILSVLEQDFYNIEIILVNDGSKDNSLRICKNWAARDPRIHYIDQKNQGVSVARNNGVKKATGKWISFVDADDLVAPNALSNVSRYLLEKYDIVVAQALLGKTNFSVLDQSNVIPYDEEISRDVYVKRLIRGHEFWTPWAKFFKRTLFDENTFKIPRRIVCGEDFIMNLRLASKTTNIRRIKEVVYYYGYKDVPNSHSMTILLKIRAWIESFRYTELNFPLKVLFLIMKIYRSFKPKNWNRDICP